jgi:hypothetical protein
MSVGGLLTERKTKFTSVNMPTTVRDRLRSVALAYSAEVGRRLSLGDVVVVALDIALAHRDEFLSALRDRPRSEPE